MPFSLRKVEVSERTGTVLEVITLSGDPMSRLAPSMEKEKMRKESGILAD